MGESDRPLRYMPQLDGLRAMAIVAVMVGHFVTWSGAVQMVRPHWLGVRLFFVISGFLITSILLREREAVEAGGSVGGAMWRFYVRRVLRIFPAYYLVLGLALWAGMDPDTNRFAAWHAAYLSNVAFARVGQWVGSSGHLWSLAVEEQFYLVWPVVVLLTPRRWLRVVLWGTVAAGPVFRGVAYGMGLNWVGCMVLTPGCMDSLGIGALLACRGNGLRGWERGVLLWGGLVVLLVGYGQEWFHGWGTAWVVCWSLGAAMVSGWVVERGAVGFGGIAGEMLAARPVRFVGRISYGIYLIHNFAWMALVHVNFEPKWMRTVGGVVLEEVAATMLMAVGMWYLYERPINGLKRWVPYVVGGKREVVAVGG